MERLYLSRAVRSLVITQVLCVAQRAGRVRRQPDWTHFQRGPARRQQLSRIALHLQHLHRAGPVLWGREAMPSSGARQSGVNDYAFSLSPCAPMEKGLEIFAQSGAPSRTGCRDGSFRPPHPIDLHRPHAPPQLGIRGTCMLDCPHLPLLPLRPCAVEGIILGMQLRGPPLRGVESGNPESVERPHTSDWLELRSPRWAPSQ